jgi:hypothetical protein
MPEPGASSGAACCSRQTSDGGRVRPAIATPLPTHRAQHAYWKGQFARLEPRLGKPKAYVAIARRMLVAAWHILSEDTADRHADAKQVACAFFAHAYRVGVRNLPGGLSALAYTRQQLDRLGAGR